MNVTRLNLSKLLSPYLSQLNSDSHTLSLDCQIHGLVTDNRDVRTGDCFIALAGITHHGKEFIADAVSRGAVAILVDESDLESVLNQQNKASSKTSVPIVGIHNLSTQVNHIILDFYRLSSSVLDLKLLAVTGTNGKSSITRFAAQMSHALKQPAGLMGTLGFGVWPNVVESKNTTPELAILLRQFALMQEQGAQQVMMEVSSHGIAQKRIEGLSFNSAVFSNLSQDHLDFHNNMEEYFSIKRSLFLSTDLQHAIINADDEYGQRLLSDNAIRAQKISYGFSSLADVRVIDWHSYGSYITASITTPWGDARFTINMVGDFNLANVLAAISLLVLNSDHSFSDIIDSIQYITSAPGRMQSYNKLGSATVVVDFAHTPAALENVLTALIKGHSNTVSVVFGCGGNRDTSKRAKMARVAQLLADRVVFTADNPRTESLDKIINNMKEGLDSADSTPIVIESDRALAIENELSTLGSNDLLLIAGKGHEHYQEIAGEKVPYSDEGVLVAMGYQNVTHLIGEESL